MDRQTDRIKELITPVLNDMGYDLVRVKMLGADGSHTLQIMAERISDGDLDIGDCEEISHALSALLDVEDPIDTAYSLEVSSPGIDRPLTRLKDFERFQNLEAKVELNAPTPEGQRRFRGRLAGIENEEILLETPEGTVKFRFDAISKAKLVLTDELLDLAAREA